MEEKRRGENLRTERCGEKIRSLTRRRGTRSRSAGAVAKDEDRKKPQPETDEERSGKEPAAIQPHSRRNMQ
ncbi:hypothetical protein NDU88_003023 [Pleurodeles waltl]|uniref:Uncharacterized protein n=1 Tax=Pleurodeles waltl TaxID=8319 RepID=A0AAV7VG64_PLEWA|nr:hypothetical protein NDU88_003023 [Pleurodeles waltl]